MEKWFVLVVAAVAINCCSAKPDTTFPINPLQALATSSSKVNPPRPDPSTLLSSILDRYNGIICSGFHIRNDYVVTIASCVENKFVGNLRVRSFVLKMTKYGYVAKLETFRVDKVFYASGREDRPSFLSLAVLRLARPPAYPVVTVSLPPYNFFSQTKSVKGVMFKSSYIPPNFATKFNGVIDSNLRQCMPPYRRDGGYEHLFFCVRQDYKKPFSVEKVDVGAPAIGIFKNNFYVVGIANVPQKRKENHLYYSVFKDLRFLQSLITSIPYPPRFHIHVLEDQSSQSSETNPSDDFITDFDPYIPPFAYIWTPNDSSDNSPSKPVDLPPSDDFIIQPLDHSLSNNADQPQFKPFVPGSIDPFLNPSDDFPSDDPLIFQSSTSVSSLNPTGTSSGKPDPDFDPFITSSDGSDIIFRPPEFPPINPF